MKSRLMSPADLVEITGRRRYSRQAKWFEEQFGVIVSRRDDHSVVMTWATYEALSARKAGLAPNITGPQPVDLCFD